MPTDSGHIIVDATVAGDTGVVTSEAFITTNGPYYKAFLHQASAGGTAKLKLEGAFSPDGVHWSVWNAILADSSTNGADANGIYATGTAVSLELYLKFRISGITGNAEDTVANLWYAVA